MNDDLEAMSKDEIVACLKVLSLKLPEVTE
jgi:hypothetical protein